MIPPERRRLWSFQAFPEGCESHARCLFLCNAFKVFCLIGLIFVRGYPHSVLPAEAKRDPSGLFQIGQIERWASEDKHTIVDWVVVGEDKSRPLRPTNPAFQGSRSIVDANALRFAPDARKAIQFIYT